MTLSTKILIFIFSLFAVSLAGFLVYKHIDNSARLDAIQKSLIEQKELTEGIMRSQAQYASKEDIEKFAKEQNLNLAAIKDDLKSLGAEVKAVGTISVISTGQVVSGLPSTSTTPNSTPIADNSDLANMLNARYLNNRQQLDLNENFKDIKVPIGSVGFSASQDKPWDINIPPRKYTVNSVIGYNENNERHYAYNQVLIDTGGKRYIVPITDAKFVEEYPVKKFSFFNPRIYLGVDGNAFVSAPVRGDVNPSLGVGVMSYGKFRSNPDLSILQVGASYSINKQLPALSISPIQYNLGQHLSPLVNNLYVGPDVVITTKGDVGFGVGIRVGL